jgi:hypothetical protein
MPLQGAQFARRLNRLTSCHELFAFTSASSFPAPFHPAITRASQPGCTISIAYGYGIAVIANTTTFELADNVMLFTVLATFKANTYP